MAVLGLRFCARALSSCGKRGPLFIAVRGPLAIAASLVAEHRLQTRRLSNCGSRAQPLRGMWDLPRPGLERVPCIGRRILNHCATREALKIIFIYNFKCSQSPLKYMFLMDRLELVGETKREAEFISLLVSNKVEIFQQCALFH